MKRQIICVKCRTEQAGKQWKYDGEWAVDVEGTMRYADYNCDLCNRPIEAGETVHCQSMGLDTQPYYEWEPRYVTVGDRTVLNGPLPRL